MTSPLRPTSIALASTLLQGSPPLSGASVHSARERMASQTQRVAAIAISLSMAVIARPAMSQNERGSEVSVPAVAYETKPLSVRNDVARPRQDVLLLRNHRLEKGGNEPFYRASRDDIWPLFKRNGTRVVGQWKVIESKSPAPSDLEDVYRLVRYASIEHWQATRFQTSLVGNGRAFDRNLKDAALEAQSKRTRREFSFSVAIHNLWR
jgi:hypothetical protein